MYKNKHTLFSFRYCESGMRLNFSLLPAPRGHSTHPVQLSPSHHILSLQLRPSLFRLSSHTLPHAFLLNWKFTLFLFAFAPPIQVLVNGLSPHTALAALTQPSHLPLVMIMVVPAVATSRSKRAVPEIPVVDVGWPPHCSIVPAMPPQMERRATLMS
jgi:hypothetical protein